MPDPGGGSCPAATHGGQDQCHAARRRPVPAPEVGSMPPTHFTVSQVRVAAACPRILYFDAVHTRAKKLKQPSVTRIWKAGKGDEGTACGPLFHAAVERFNDKEPANAAVRRILESAVDSSALAQEL